MEDLAEQSVDDLVDTRSWTKRRSGTDHDCPAPWFEDAGVSDSNTVKGHGRGGSLCRI